MAVVDPHECVTDLVEERFPDLFGRPTLGAQGAPLVTCDQPFYPFAILYWGLPGNPFLSILPWIEFVPPIVPLGAVP